MVFKILKKIFEVLFGSQDTEDYEDDDVFPIEVEEETSEEDEK